MGETKTTSGCYVTAKKRDSPFHPISPQIDSHTTAQQCLETCTRELRVPKNVRFFFFTKKCSLLRSPLSVDACDCICIFMKRSQFTSLSPPPSLESSKVVEKRLSLSEITTHVKLDQPLSLWFSHAVLAAFGEEEEIASDKTRPYVVSSSCCCHGNLLETATSFDASFKSSPSDCMQQLLTFSRIKMST